MDPDEVEQEEVEQEVEPEEVETIEETTAAPDLEDEEECPILEVDLADWKAEPTTFAAGETKTFLTARMVWNAGPASHIYAQVTPQHEKAHVFLELGDIEPLEGSHCGHLVARRVDISQSPVTVIDGIHGSRAQCPVSFTAELDEDCPGGDLGYNVSVHLQDIKLGQQPTHHEVVAISSPTRIAPLKP